MNQYVWETAEEMDAALAKRIRGIRKRRRLTQQDLSERSGVSLGTLKRFETTGQISLLSLTKLAIALGCENEIRSLFDNVVYESIEEVIDESKG
ncbi:MAG: helix-turn-helix transcriptional regulator [Oscillospiraceae bacterium]|jgi:transcriptional regulator with XRE-family HTH domain|nr:helix-turn-helix transcriptional regulator [Oscillospiraceae bacterium]